VHSLLPDAKIDARAAAIVETAVRRQVGFAFESLHVLVLARIAELRGAMRASGAVGSDGGDGAGAADRGVEGDVVASLSAAEAPSADELKAISVGMCDDIDDVLIGMRPLVRTGSSVLAELGASFGDLVHAQLQDTLLWINDALTDIAVPELVRRRSPIRRPINLQSIASIARALTDASLIRSTDLPSIANHSHRASQVEVKSATSAASGLEVGEPLAPRIRARFLLSLALLCRHLERHGVTQSISTLLENMPAPSFASGASADGRGDGGVGSSGGSAAQGMAAVPELVRRTKLTSQKLLRAYVAAQGGRLGRMLRLSVETCDWRAARGGPREVREAYVCWSPSAGARRRRLPPCVRRALVLTHPPTCVRARPRPRAKTLPNDQHTSRYVLFLNELTAVAVDTAALFDSRLQRSPLRARKGAASVATTAPAGGAAAAADGWNASAVGLQVRSTRECPVFVLRRVVVQKDGPEHTTLLARSFP
jgi:hypothetical protein